MFSVQAVMRAVWFRAWALGGWIAFASTSLFSQTATTNPLPPEIEIIPLANAYGVTKHPLLPVLYVTRYHAPQSKNLATFRLNADGTVLNDSLRVCDDYLSAGGKDPYSLHTLLRPCVLPNQNALILVAHPENLKLYLANTNHNELAVVELDDQGQPGKLRRSFRTNRSGWVHLIGAQVEPATRRLFLVHFAVYDALGWLELGEDGVPLSNTLKFLPGKDNHWYWTFYPDARRFFAIGEEPILSVVKFSEDGATEQQRQYVAMPAGTPRNGCFETNAQFRKIYLLGSAPNRELTVCQFTRDGRLTGVPRYFALTGAVLLRFNFHTSTLYTFQADGLSVYKLDSEGYPAGPPKRYAFNWGGLRDALVDETTGKVYVACAQPPTKSAQ
jgi:hypothetical protein